MGFISKEQNALLYQNDGEWLRIMPWGENGLRVQCTRMGSKKHWESWALLEGGEYPAEEICVSQEKASITNGKMTCTLDRYGRLSFLNRDGKILTQERWQGNYEHAAHNALGVKGRALTSITGGKYSAKVLFKGYDDEKFYGMGQHVEPYLNLKGCQLELGQRNGQVNIPFLLSTRGYGLLWNNPAYGSAALSRNQTEWMAAVTEGIDYWITAGDTIAQMVEQYAQVTGTTPMMPEYGTGFWQSRLRYKTQDEVLRIAREYKRRGLPISMIVIDYFHWPQQGDFCFDPKAFPDPEAMVDELRGMGIETMVSVWPTVDPRSVNHEEMKAKGYLVQSERGVQLQMLFKGNERFYDATNDEAREFLFSKIESNYLSKGVRNYWLDVSEPEALGYEFDNIRYHAGTNLEVGNIYPLLHAKGFYDGLRKAGVSDVINLTRSAFAGAQRYGIAVWSGDIASSFESLRTQVCAGLNMGLSGIPWWNTDIGGFYCGDPADPSFRELVVRWFQYGVFCPICRLHGYRLPNALNETNPDVGDYNVDVSGDNEVWSFGDEAYGILCQQLRLRERLRPYIAEQMKRAHEKGTPVIRPLFYDFPDDPKAYEIEDAYMFGPDMLVAPVLHEGQRSRSVYLPQGEWFCAYDRRAHAGGAAVEVETPIEHLAVFVRREELLCLFEE